MDPIRPVIIYKRAPGIPIFNLSLPHWPVPTGRDIWPISNIAPVVDWNNAGNVVASDQDQFRTTPVSVGLISL